MKESPTVLITGAAGSLGRIVTDNLIDRGWIVRLLDRTPIVSDCVTFTGSVNDLTLMEEACQGVSGVVHFGGASLPGLPWGEYLETNIDGTRTVLEACRKASVGRVALASSNHAVGYVERIVGNPVSASIPVRPDSLYGVSKAAIEALGSFYADEYGVRTTSLRIGSCFPRPTTRRMLSTWLSPGDLERLVVAALEGPWSGHTTVWGISRNTRRWWSLTEGERIGFFPQDDAEIYAEGVDLSDSSFIGGSAPSTGRSLRDRR